MAQEQKKHGSTEVADESVDTTKQDAEAERKGKLDEDIDSILGEIDDVLETNAEEFVKSFIQKGGQ